MSTPHTSKIQDPRSKIQKRFPLIQDRRTKNFNTKILRILVLNWRDIKNPAGGGAEILTHELAKGWVGQGHEVTVLSSKFLGAQPTDIIDGVKFERRGKWWSVHIFAFLYYLKHKKQIDVIVDEVHWFPFFSAVYARKKTIALTCETASKLLFTLFPYPIAHFFRAVEKVYLRIYKDIPTMTISDSTKEDLIKAGVNPKKITVLKMGINIPKNLKKYPKEKSPTFIYLARLNKQKGIFDAIEAFSLIYKQLANSHKPTFWVVGSGEESIVRQVKDLVKKYGLEKSVEFFGFVSEEKKFELLARAHILLVPSVHEGWGLTVHEAASQKTPSIVYNVSGLRDTVENEITGIILKNNKPEVLADEAISLLMDKNRYKNFQQTGIHKINNDTWKDATHESLKIIKSTL